MSTDEEVVRLLAEATVSVVEAERLLVEMEMTDTPSTNVLRLRRCASELSVLAVTLDGGRDLSAV
jgi:hypothetical protein